MLQRFFALAAMAGLCLSAGCSGRPAEISYPESGATLTGTVSYGKDRVSAALVVAQNETGCATGFVDDDGRFKLANVPLGEVGIGINTKAGKGMALGKLMAQSQGKARGAPRIVEVPDKYADPVKSGIKTTISKGENEFDVVIPK